MSLRRPLLYFVTIFALACAGCPVDPGSTVDTVPDGGSSSSGTGSAGSSGVGTGAGLSGGTSGGTQPFDDQLIEQFPTCSEPIAADAWRDEVLRLVNVERERAGLAAVRHGQTLEDQATQYACEMIHYDFFAHVNPVTGTQLEDRAGEFGYEYLTIGENLAAGQSSPSQVIADWMNSPGHRGNILNRNFTELGVGVRTGGRYGTYWVQEFGRPLN